MRGTLTSSQTLVLAIVFAVIHSGCTSDPRAYPYVLEQETFRAKPKLPVDVDGDGRDELVGFGIEGVIHNVSFERGDLASVNQVNFNEPISNRPLVVDVENDGREDVLVPIVRNDSLFLSRLDVDLANRSVEKALEIFVATGKGIERDGVWYPWTVGAHRVYMINPGTSEPRMLVGVNAGFAREPRGIIELSGENWKTRREFLIGPKMTWRHEPSDLDGDGDLDLIFATSAPDNGANVGGFADSLSYLFALDLDSLRIIWSEATGRNGQVAMTTNVSDFGVGSALEVATTVRRSPHHTTIRFRDATTGVVQRQFTHPIGVDQLYAIKTKQGTADLVFLDQNGKICRLSSSNSELKTLARNGVTNLETGFDIDSDGVDDLFAFKLNGMHAMNTSGRKLAYLPMNGIAVTDVLSVRAGLVIPDRLLLYGPLLSATYRVRANPWYIFFRYWPALPVVVGLCILFLPVKLSSTVVRLRQRARAVDQKIEEQELKIDSMNATIARLQEQAVAVVLPKPDSSFPMQIKDVLDRYALDPSFDVEKFGGKLGYSTRQTIRKVKAATGKSPNEVIWLYRIENAKTLLREGEMTIAEVADASGFKSQAHFSTKFRELEGVKPSEWK